MNPDSTWDEMAASGIVAGVRSIFLDRTGSTNDDALALFAGEEPAPLLVVAEAQSRGRGRMGRSWFSSPGLGLCFTLLLTPDLAPEQVSLTSLAAGVACAGAIRQTCGIDIGLKWPNDLIAGDRKLGGILCETAPLKPGDAVTVAVGVGINVNTDILLMDPEIRGRAISLAELAGRKVERGPLLYALVESIISEVRELADTGTAPLIEKWRKRDWIKGRKLTWMTADGREIIGIASGISHDGFLMLRDRDGTTMPVISGDIKLLDW